VDDQGFQLWQEAAWHRHKRPDPAAPRLHSLTDNAPARRLPSQALSSARFAS
jgi:hypothetical protein